MRLGAPLFESYADPQGWVDALKKRGYNAAYCPVGLDASAAQIDEYAQAAQEHDIVIAEVGAWLNNPLHPDPATAEHGYRGLVAAMTLAERIGARCCVNVSGAKS
jgi:sugar phosphate isomerase/epimerase